MMIEETDITEQEFYEHFRIVADKGQTPLRIDRFLFDRMSNISRNRIQNAAVAGSILVNEAPVKSNYKVRPNDVISIVLPHPPHDKEICPENIPLNIVYEDDDLLIVNKTPNMVVHPGFGNFTGTLVHALLYHLNKDRLDKGFDESADKSFCESADKSSDKSSIKNSDKSSDKSSDKNSIKSSNKSSNKSSCEGDTPLKAPLLVHRIDKDTSGLLLVAKNEIAQTFLAKQFFEHTVERTYQALVWGDIEDPEGTITGNIDRSTKDRKIMAVFPDEDKGKHAVTHYKVLHRFGYVTLVECRLETGRTHQIRVHFKYIKHPLFADESYGGREIVKGTTFTRYKQFVENCFKILPRQALHAKTLGFVHPSTKKKMLFDSELPQDMSQVIEKWNKSNAF
ncbi:MAG: RluA family pseudouridine synthase [Bacteroidales bacterium]|jgi:23S rRNA pseudouridine1911/1915/1917 synthase|nr:RluA family pseudouridine synthase [Bacteroidales bacterium]